MRLLGLLGLVLTLVIVGLIAKKQFTSIAAPQVVAPAASGADTPGQRQQTPQQLLEQIKQSVEAGTQPRALPDDK